MAKITIEIDQELFMQILDDIRSVADNVELEGVETVARPVGATPCYGCPNWGKSTSCHCTLSRMNIC